jgi:hypothetical protein
MTFQPAGGVTEEPCSKLEGSNHHVVFGRPGGFTHRTGGRVGLVIHRRGSSKCNSYLLPIHTRKGKDQPRAKKFTIKPIPSPIWNFGLFYQKRGFKNLIESRVKI